MLTIYKRVEKSDDNLRGIVEVENGFDIDKPILLCLSAQDNHDKSIYGIMRQGMAAGRLYTTVDDGALFKLADFPVDFLGVRYRIDESRIDKATEIVEKLIYPIINNGNKDIESVIKRARRINIMTYCDGTLTYEAIERILKEKLLGDGHSDDDVRRIINEIKLVAIGTMVDTRELDATSVTFVDVNDNEIVDERTGYFRKLLGDNNANRVFGTLNKDNNCLFLYNGSGNHSLKEYFKSTSLASPALFSVVTRMLEATVAGEKISSEDLITALDTYSREDTPYEELVSRLDSSLSYGGALKYTKGEAALQRKLDATYNKMAILVHKNELLEDRVKTGDQKMSNVIGKIREYSSDTTFHQILGSAKLYQFARRDDNILAAPSDREIRGLYEELQEKGKTL